MRLRGVNLGGWLLMEGYLLGGRNIPEREFKIKFKKKYGRNELEKFEAIFSRTFVTEEDFKNISTWRANCVRIPFHYRLVEKRPFSYDERGFVYLKNALDWAKKYNLKVILDLHAAPGAQNCDWHSDSRGAALLWDKEVLRERIYRLWEMIADRFKDDEALYGYDVLNEPVVITSQIKVLHKFYKKLISTIKNVDKNHIIFLEGNLWATKIDFLKDLLGNNIHISVHVYQPLDFVFNFVSYYKYPGWINKKLWNKNKLRKYLEPYYTFSKKNNIEIFVGEFGINWRGSFYGEGNYLNDVLDTFEQFSFDYTYWTYKSVKNFCFPDGIYQYIYNPKYIQREGPSLGWESYLAWWGKEKDSLVNVWRTKNYTLNLPLLNILKKYFKKNYLEV